MRIKYLHVLGIKTGLITSKAKNEDVHEMPQPKIEIYL